MNLTPKQAAVVAHDDGPALVFAVAGAGKTTAMIHRIERLVREQRCPAHQILATSFSRESALELKRRLNQWPACREVHVSTLHSLGYKIIEDARRSGLLPGMAQQGGRTPGPLEAQEALRRQVLQQAQNDRLPFLRELYELDWADFQDYVGSCKGNLCYAALERELDSADFPAAARALASQAVPPSNALGWYLDLYQLVETLRRRAGWITFDDMLLSGWELLHRHPELLRRWQQRHHMVLVDEFQDINLAQSEILDLLVAPHRNYMAIGDDDQTIYEWRGAQPAYILDFEQRYGASTYVMDENFRCPAGPLVLANAVIGRNQRRHPKQLRLTQGFHGATRLHTCPSWEAAATGIVDEIERQHTAGRAWDEMAVLVRLNGQTPFVEQTLIQRHIPYRVSQPFYDRWEIQGLLGFGLLALLEKQLQAGRKMTPAEKEQLRAAWWQTYNRPKRYLSRRVAETILGQIETFHQPVTTALTSAAGSAREHYLQERLLQFADDIAWSADRLDQPAGPLLTAIEQRLGYCHYLQESAAHVQIATGRVLSVRALLQFAHQSADLAALLRQIDSLRQARQQERPANGHGKLSEGAVTISTIHQAKGLEWPVVFVPNLNDGIIPFLRGSADSEEAALEEERRLLYVAITRARQTLHLYAVQDEPLSRFLAEINAPHLIGRINRATEAVLASDADRISATALHDLVQIVRSFELGRYFEQWWPAGKTGRAGLGRAIGRLARALERQQLWQAADITPEELAWWSRQVPQGEAAAEEQGREGLSAESDPPGLPEWRAQLHTPPAATVVTQNSLQIGMSVICDLGQGVIRRLVGDRGRTVTSAPPELLHYVYLLLESGNQLRLDLRGREILNIRSGVQQPLRLFHVGDQSTTGNAGADVGKSDSRKSAERR